MAETQMQASAVAPPPQKARIAHLPALDGLRGLAVFGVLLYHGGYLDGGYLGVDLFFVLSGFLITSLLLVEHGDRGSISLGSFWSRRARRLLAGLYLFLTGVLVYCLVWARPIDLGQIRGDVYAALLYVSNWWNIHQDADYWAISLAPSPLQHLWSLAIEEQFYVVWPLVVVAVTRRRSPASAPARVLTASIIGMTLSVLAFVVLQVGNASTTRLYEGTDTRAFGLFCGTALAAWWRIDQRRERTSSPGRSVLQALGPLAFLILAAAWFTIDGRDGLLYHGGLQVCSLLAMVVIGASVLPGGIPVFNHILKAAPLRLLGLISYGVYLWHWPVYLVLNEVRTGLHGVVLLLVRIAVSLSLAAASYLLVEHRVRIGALRGRRGAIAVPVCMVAIGLLAIPATSAAVSVGDVNVTDPAHQSTIQIPGAPRVLFVGDSVAGSVGGYPVRDPKAYGINAYNDGQAGCGLMYEGNRVRGGAGDISEPAACSPDWPAIVDQQRPAASVLLFGAAPTSAIEIDGEFRTACEPEYQHMLRDRLEEQVSVLGAAGGKVALVTNAPTTNPFRLPETDADTVCFNKVVRDVAKDGPAEVIDLAEFICPDGKCQDEMDGAPIRPDSLHFNGPGGAVPVGWLIDQVKAMIN